MLKDNITDIVQSVVEPNEQWWRNSLQVLARPCSTVPEMYSMSLYQDMISLVQRYRTQRL